MRIAYCIHSLSNSGGIERVVSLKASYLAEKLDYEVFIITARQKGRKAFFPLSDKVKLVDLGVNDRSLLGLGRYRRKLQARLSSLGIDVSLSVCGNELYALHKCRDASVKIAEFHFAHDKFYYKYGKGYFGKLYASLRTSRLEKAASFYQKFIVLTKRDKAVWDKHLNNVLQIYNPLSFLPADVSALSSKRCIAVGRLEDQKNFGDLIKAWKIVARNYPQWQLDIFGEGSKRNELQKQISALALDDVVHLRGNTSDMQKEYLGCSCMVACSSFEGFPLAQLEASACGLPLVSYDCPCGPSEIIDNGVSGYLCHSGDIQGLADCILKLISGDLKPLGQAARKKAESFKIDSIMHSWDTVFKSL